MPKHLRFPERAIAQVCRVSDGSPVGLAFAVAPRHLVTCAHVVNAALDRAQQEPPPPVPAKLLLTFPYGGKPEDQPERRATVSHWLPERGSFDLNDIAVLALKEDLPVGVPVLSIAKGDPRGRVQMWGPSPDRSNGGFVTGTLMGEADKVRRLVEEERRGVFQVGPGFSGGPAWQVSSDRIVGVVQACGPDDKDTDVYVLGPQLIPEAILPHDRPARLPPMWRRWRTRMAIALVSVIVAITAIVFLLQDQHGACRAEESSSPKDYLKGKVYIGVNGRTPGWSLAPEGSNNQQWSGFDVALARFFADRHKFTPHFVSLKPGERENALESCDVDLVLASYSITPEREQRVDFAGPYFLDRSGLLYSRAKFGKQKDQSSIGVSQVCATSKTTANDYLKSGAVIEESLPACMALYDDPYHPVLAVVTDETILAAYAKARGKHDTAMPAIWVGEEYPINQEAYGVGLPNQTPALCAAINADIRDFMEKAWESTFDSHLASSQSMSGHAPTGIPSWLVSRGWNGCR